MFFQNLIFQGVSCNAVGKDAGCCAIVLIEIQIERIKANFFMVVDYTRKVLQTFFRIDLKKEK
jgi:hypothetical protein